MNKRIVFAMLMILASVCFVFTSCGEDNKNKDNNMLTTTTNISATTTARSTDSMMPSSNIDNSTEDGAIEEGIDRIENGIDDIGDDIAGADRTNNERDRANANNMGNNE